jgi:type II secretion system protein H
MRQRGYTLLEILVVVAVIAILSSALLLSARGAGSDRLIEDEARRLALVLQLMCDQAVIEGRHAGLGYALSSYSTYELSPRGWQIVERNGPLKTHRLREGLELVEADADQALPPVLPQEPQLLCAPTGEVGEHDLLLAPVGGDTGWRLALNRDGISELTAWTRP